MSYLDDGKTLSMSDLDDGKTLSMSYLDDGKTLSISYLDDGGQGLFQNGLAAQQLHAQRLLELDGTHLLEFRLQQALGQSC